jgi:SAM-dependent methyltransferase
VLKNAPTGIDRTNVGCSSNDFWDLQKLANARRFSDFMFEQVPTDIGPRVVEIGAGIGTCSARLLEAGTEELLLIEPYEPFAAELRRRFVDDPRVDVRCEALPDCPSLTDRPAAFDFVLSQNVLEHIADDQAAMSAMARAVGPGGRLMALVPAHPRLYGPLDRKYGHYRRYTRDRLRSIVGAAGLHIDRLYAHNVLGIVGWWATNRSGGDTIGHSSLRLYDALLAAWRPVERRIDPPIGLSLIVHARRPREEGSDG